MPAIIKEYNSSTNGVNMHDQLKTVYELDRKTRSRYYLRIFFDLMGSAAINALLIYKKVEVNTTLFDFKVNLAESLINKYSSRKEKATSGEVQLPLAVRVSCTEPQHMVLFTEKRKRCAYCYTNGKENTKCFGFSKTWYVSLCLQRTEIVSNSTTDSKEH